MLRWTALGIVALAGAGVMASEAYAAGVRRDVSADAPLRCAVVHDGKVAGSLSVPANEFGTRFVKSLVFSLSGHGKNCESTPAELQVAVSRQEDSLFDKKVEMIGLHISSGAPGFIQSGSGPYLATQKSRSVEEVLSGADVMNFFEMEASWGNPFGAVCLLGSEEDLRTAVAALLGVYPQLRRETDPRDTQRCAAQPR